MPASSRFRARRPIRAGFLTTAIATLFVGGTAGAGDGSTPSKIEVEYQQALTGVTQTWAIHAGGAPVLVRTFDATAPGNPEGIGISRGAGHKIVRGTAGTPLELGRVVGDEDGTIAVFYRVGLQTHTRLVKADNSLAFDIYRPAHRLAGVTPDGEGGAYLATHASFKPEGSVLADHTKHTTIRYSPTGTVLWEVAQPPVPDPYTVPQHRSVAAKSSLGVFVGYAVEGRSNLPKPILVHHAKADGAILFENDALKGSKVSRGKIVPGAVGTGELEAFVEHVVAASDGSVLAVLHNHGQQQWIIRVDASGQQTETFVCEGHAAPIQPQEIACVDRRSGGESFGFTRYGVADGKLVRSIGMWEAPKKAGRTYGEIAGLPGRQLLVEAHENDELRLLLLSKTGTVLTEYDANIEHNLDALGASSTAWTGGGGTWVLRGKLTLGSSGPKPSTSQANPGVSKLPK